MQFHRHLFKTIVCICLSSSLYAQGTISHRVNWIKDPTVAKIVMKLQKEGAAKNANDNALNLRMQEINQQQIKILTDLKNQIKSFNPKSNSIDRLTKLIAQKNNIKNFNLQDASTINLLNIQFSDAISMLISVTNATNQTVNALQHMQELVIAAASGTMNNDDLKNINAEFQAYKNAIRYVQTVDLINGEKKVSGGNIIIQIGDETNNASTLVINIPRFDLDALGLTNLAIDSTTSARDAIGILDEAIKTSTRALFITDSSLLTDAETMIDVLAFSLVDDFVIFSNTRDLIFQSVNGIFNDFDRELFDNQFNYEKAALTQIQTYVSLNGPKTLGGGSLHIQIGNEPLPETRLDIDLPVTDITKLGIDQTNVRTIDAGYNALNVMLKSIRAFVYGNASK